MKVIFSRKGFDRTAGGCPSPIVDGHPLSLPIPSKKSTPTRYGDLAGPYAGLIADLSGGRLNAADWCHLDPDIVAECLPRSAGWRGALGQAAAAQGHLSNQGVGIGDLFIFWGLFQHVRYTDRWAFVGRPEHRIWGWLQVGEVVPLGCDGSHAVASRPWLIAHPHVCAGWDSNNVLYIAAKRLRLGSCELNIDGYGALRKGYRLSQSGALPSTWLVPKWLHPGEGGSGMTYHPSHRWGEDGTVRSAPRGQEFVALPDGGAEVHDWLGALVMDALV